MNKYKTFKTTSLRKDLLTGVIVAILSIPLSIGYALVAGLPPQYGLYGSFVPVLVFGLLTSSPRFVFGIDAVSAVMVATMLEEAGIAFGSERALKLVPAVTFLTSLWIALFWLVGAGKFINYVSKSVLAGCVSGISCIVILAQFPRLFGGKAATGRAFELILHIWHEIPGFHFPSFLIGTATIAFVLWGQRRLPVSPSVIAMGIGIMLSIAFPLESFGVEMLPPIPKGLPPFEGPDLSYLMNMPEEIVVDTLTLAIVIVAETLVSTRAYSHDFKDRIDNQREILTYSVGNLASVFWGNSPIGGSIARTRRAGIRNVQSQWMSVSSFITMGLFLLFGTPILEHLPVPVLTGLVVASLVTMLEFDHALHLFKLDRFEFYIFLGAFLAEFIGLFEGVVLGVILSFASFTIRSCKQPKRFLGVVEGKSGYFDLSETSEACPLPHTVMYECQGALFYANVDEFWNDITNSISENTGLVLVVGITTVDFYSMEIIKQMFSELNKKQIEFRIIDSSGNIRSQLESLGCSGLFLDKILLQTIDSAL